MDVSILKEELERLGHRANLCDYDKVNNISSADINLFLAQFKPEWFSKAKLNWFIPNAEFCTAALKDLRKFDLVVCKTEESLRIFQPLSREVYYLGFTSFDHYYPSLSLNKNFSKYLHVAGKSKMKGTEAVIRAWQKNSRFPKLVLLKHHTHAPFMIPKNIKLINKRISDQGLLTLQNECGIHLCPSKTEGFGHYLMEAMSTGAVVITTHGPPMNEFIKDERCLVKYKTVNQKRYATLYLIDDQSLTNTVKNLQKLSIEELQSIGQRNREEYLRRAVEFKHNFEELMHKAVRDLSENNLFRR
jgi:glycosyltransferase involved in cell wall biosynthesis